jgi:hypothetical protein
MTTAKRAKVRVKYDEFRSICANCGPTNRIIIRGRCYLCYNYFHHLGRERPLQINATPAPVWGEFHPGPKEIKLNEIWCDCGKAATWTLIVPISERATARLLLCDACAALERRLAPVHSWKGD